MGQFFVSPDIQRLPYCTDKRVARMSVRTKWQKYGHKKTGQTVACPRCLEVLVFLFYYRRLFSLFGRLLKRSHQEVVELADRRNVGTFVGRMG